MIQIRHVPDDLHRKLKARAAAAGMSLSDYLLEQARRISATPTMDEVVDRIAHRRPVTVRESASAAVRAEREGR